VAIKSSFRGGLRDVTRRYAAVFDLVKARLSRTRNEVALTRRVG
jgi:hypothetical protein